MFRAIRYVVSLCLILAVTKICMDEGTWLVAKVAVTLHAVLALAALHGWVSPIIRHWQRKEDRRQRLAFASPLVAVQLEQLIKAEESPIVRQHLECALNEVTGWERA